MDGHFDIQFGRSDCDAFRSENKLLAQENGPRQVNGQICVCCSNYFHINFGELSETGHVRVVILVYYMASARCVANEDERCVLFRLITFGIYCRQGDGWVVDIMFQPGLLEFYFVKINKRTVLGIKMLPVAVLHNQQLLSKQLCDVGKTKRSLKSVS